MLLKIISCSVFKVAGWKMDGDIPAGIDKCVIIVAPHTSNFDYFIGMAAKYKLRLPILYLIKEEWLKRFLIGGLMKSSGAIGVTRSERKSMVDQMAELLQNGGKAALVFPPEGTRKLATKWKSGFYYVALKAKVPIVFAALNYGKKVVSVGAHFMPSGDYDKDMDIVRDFYRGVEARHPEKFSLPT